MPVQVDLEHSPASAGVCLVPEVLSDISTDKPVRVPIFRQPYELELEEIKATHAADSDDGVVIEGFGRLKGSTSCDLPVRAVLGHEDSRLTYLVELESLPKHSLAAIAA